MSPNHIYFIYDGECPLCRYAAQAFRIQQAIGNLHLIDAREGKQHPLVAETRARNLNIDDGMIIVYQDIFYQGKDALHFMAMIGTDEGWFNKLNAFLFRSKSAAKLCYPALRATRNLLLRIKGVPPVTEDR